MPEDARIYAEVLVCEQVAETSHALPGYFRPAIKDLIGKIGCRLADDLEIALS